MDRQNNLVNEERLNCLAAQLWEIQEGRYREGTKENTARLLRVAVKFGEVTAYQLGVKLAEIAPDRPIAKYLREIVRAASQVPATVAMESVDGPRQYIPWDDWRAMEQMAEKHQCECAGHGLLSRQVPRDGYRSGVMVSFACRCPIGRERLATMSGIEGIEKWEERYGKQLKLWQG